MAIEIINRIEDRANTIPFHSPLNTVTLTNVIVFMKIIMMIKQIEVFNLTQPLYRNKTINTVCFTYSIKTTSYGHEDFNDQGTDAKSSFSNLLLYDIH